ncbi:UDP-N-acetylmuramoyl-L-alanine--D-glutamate ligase [Pseudoroseomonas globiformis]|uniref:UDP-N-acetylmuramoylalanine--D-glutamate ligase n=1 Tax=Teichococcus globiformis TaxID=2307229 RepID=A0ABV7G1N6_9PROT
MQHAAPLAASPFLPFAGQRIAVLGLGRAGLPAAARLRDWGAEILCWDDHPPAREAAAARGLPLGDPAAQRGFPFDMLLLSPGIPHEGLKAHPAAIAARGAGVPVLADAELLFRAVRAHNSSARFVGVTGTNGKSTTTALIHHLLQAAGRKTAVGGNLGPAALSLDLLGDDGIYVLEMSSYMLERLRDLHFNVAVQLNLSPDHLDRHGDMAGYAAAKAHIFDNQQSEDVAVIGMDDASGVDFARGRAARVAPVSGHAAQPGGVWAEDRLLRDAEGVLADLDTAGALPGRHNAQNAAAAAATVLALGLPRTAIASGLVTFPGLPHRQERVGAHGGIVFVNDSKATNADSAERALSSYPRVVWIAGGVQKEGGIAPLAPLFDRVVHAVLIGQCAGDFAATLAAHDVPHEVAGTLDAAVPAALRAARRLAADTVLLSPACASFDQFTGFDARGDRFRALVAQLPETA